MIDIFSKSMIDSIEERAGVLLSQKDLREERHDMKKTDEDIFEDFMHNIDHPFMFVILNEAKKYAKTGDAFVLRQRINVLTDDKNSEASLLYYNNGDTWRQSGEALVSKWLKETIPELYMPGLRLGVKGLRLLLDAYPERFVSIREELKKRAEKKEEKTA